MKRLYKGLPSFQNILRDTKYGTQYSTELIKMYGIRFFKNILSASSHDCYKPRLHLIHNHDNSINESHADNMVCPSSFLENQSKNESPIVRMAIALNPRTEKSILAKLCSDPDTDVRYFVASANYLPIPLLWKLANDEQPNVQSRARKTLTELGIIKEAY